jgi:general secretion pathway protein D
MIGHDTSQRRRPGRVHWRALTVCTLLIGSALMAGCAGQAAFSEGQRLITQGQLESGLGKFQEAMSLDPRSGEFRRAYIIAKDQASRDLVDQADRLRESGQFDGALSLYRRVLNIDSRSDRARSGIAMIERSIRQTVRLSEARKAMDAKDWTVAADALAAILSDDPSNVQAVAMRRELASLSAPAPVESGLAAAYKKPISIEFKEVPLKQAFEVISKTSGLNFVFDKDVKGETKTSIYLRNSTVESVLYFLLLTNQLEQQVMNGNTLLIYPNNPAKLKDYQELSVRTFQMANTDVKSVAAALKTLFKGRDVVVDEKLNMLVVRDTPEALKLVEKLVAIHDVAEPEVMLEVEVLEVSRNKLLELGIRWPDGATFSPLASNDNVGLTVSDLKHLKYSTIGVGIGDTKVNARKEDTDVNILANPRIRVINREKAKILIGDKLPLITSSITSTGVTSESINYLDVGLKLDVEPTIYRGNDIVIKVGLEVSSISGAQVSKQGTTAYTIGTRNAATVLRLKDGENQMLAGLINDEDRRTANKIPGLGDLPIAGRLFGSSLDEGKKTEIVLSITPHLVRNVPRPDAGIQEFRSGTENSLRERPISMSPVAGPTSPVATPASPVPSPTSPAASPTSPSLPAAVAPPMSVAVPEAQVEPPMVVMAGKSTRSRADDDDEDAGGDSSDVAVSLSWAGAHSAAVGREFTVALSTSTSASISAMPVTVGFDPAVMELVRVEGGGWLGGEGSRTPFVSGDGTLARLTFKAILAGATGNITVLKASPIGRKGAMGKASLPPAHQVWIQQ